MNSDLDRKQVSGNEQKPNVIEWFALFYLGLLALPQEVHISRMTKLPLQQHINLQKCLFFHLRPAQTGLHRARMEF